MNMSALEAFLAVAYVMGTAVALFGFAIPRVGEAYENLRHAREQSHAQVTPSDVGDDWVRYRARRYLRSIVSGLLLVVFWPVVAVVLLLAATARLLWDAI